jgi:hypothetical protein
MLTLDLTNAPRWYDLAPSVRVRLRPLTTALMVATRNDPEIENLAGEVSDDARALVFARALARRAVLEWEGVGDADGNPIDPDAAAINALLDIWPIFEALQLTYVSRGLLLEQEKNVSAPSPTGTTAGRRRLRCLRAKLLGLPRAAERAAHAGGLAGLGPRRAPRRPASRDTRRGDRLGHDRGTGAGPGAGREPARHRGTAATD